MPQVKKNLNKATEINITGTSPVPVLVSQVETAIPVFIGYTEKAVEHSSDLVMQPKKISSRGEYEMYFGKAPKEKNLEIDLTEIHNNAGQLVYISVSARINGSPSTVYMMYYALQMFFTNGGGDCYIISVDEYATGAGAVSGSRLEAGLFVLEHVDEPTLINFPDAQNLNSEVQFKSLMDLSLTQCGKLRDRFTILDVYSNTNNISGDRDFFRNACVGNTNLSYGSVYYPNLITNLEYNYDDIDVKLNIRVKPDTGAAKLTSSNLHLLESENQAVFLECKDALKQLGVEIAPGSTVAGIIALVDAERGVWKTSANETVEGVKSLRATISDQETRNLNIDTVSGKSINAIRSFTGRGILVWGTRTLDGNNNEWRYVNVRRFFIMVEESAKKAVANFVFEPNNANTWVKIQAMLENYLIILWREGALAGAKPEEAFYVRCGLGQTMTAQDILEGRLIVEIGMAALRPAEFIILQFMQKMN